MFLSVIIPIYKVENYLTECLDSLFIQDIPENDYELICINDGSPDSCASILEQYSSIHSNIVIITQKNEGVSSARNTGIRAAKGDYIWFVDPDDIVVPKYLSFFKSYLENNQVDLLLFKSYYFTDFLSESEKNKATDHTLTPTTVDSGITARLIKRKAVIDSGVLFNTELTIAEDKVFIMQLDEYVDSVEYINDVVYCYRQHGSSVMHRLSEELRIKRLYSYIIAAEIALETYNHQIEKKQSTADYVMYFIWNALINIASRRDIIADEHLQIMKDKKLFPINRLPESIYQTAFATTRKDLMGKTYDYLSTHSHTRLGLQMLKMYHIVSDMVNRNLRKY